MQIDVLSQNTLKLTLSRLDMFDLDIKYESLSGKNPDTKRLLSHALRTVKLDKNAGVDFTGERLFVEAFPRPDGGCMLYVSCLEESNSSKPDTAEKRTVSLASKIAPSTAIQTKPAKTSESLCALDSIKSLERICKSLSWQITAGRLELESKLYEKNGEYRLLLRSNNKNLISAIGAECGAMLRIESHLPFTYEHYNLVAADNAVEKMNALL